jgi:hypothetical protein
MRLDEGGCELGPASLSGTQTQTSADRDNRLEEASEKRQRSQRGEDDDGRKEEARAKGARPHGRCDPSCDPRHEAAYRGIFHTSSTQDFFTPPVRTL